jgi:hypothetical protein
LRSKVAPGETPGFPGQANLRRSIATGGSLALRRLYESGGKLGGAHGSRLKLMPQLEPEVPDPLRDDLPGRLPTRRVRTPAIGVLFLVFIGKGRFKGSTMQIEGDDIGSGASALGQIGEEEFVDEGRRG